MSRTERRECLANKRAVQEWAKLYGFRIRECGGSWIAVTWTQVGGEWKFHGWTEALKGVENFIRAVELKRQRDLGRASRKKGEIASRVGERR